MSIFSFWSVSFYGGSAQASVLPKKAKTSVTSLSQLSASAQVDRIASEYEKAFFNRSPENAMFWGRSDAALDRFMDHSPAGFLAWQKLEDRLLVQLHQLKEQDLKGTSQYKTYLLLKETLEGAQGARICREELWDLNPLWGWHNVLTNVAEKQPVGTPEKRELALKRWRTVDSVVSDEIGNLKLGLKLGFSAPKPVVQRVLKQLRLILNSPLESSPFFIFAKQDGNAEFKKAMTEVIQKSIQPAFQRYADYLEKEYLPLARVQVGTSSLPKGVRCYAAKVRKETTLKIPPRKIFETGLAHMQELEREVAEIGQRTFGLHEMSEVFRQGKLKSQKFFQNEKEILKYNEAALEKVNTKIPLWFSRVPRAKGTLQPYPLHRAQTGAPGEYRPPTEDGTQPGIFYINTYLPENKSRIDQEATLFHELIPGHHFQIALALEDQSGHSLNKYLWNSGFGEGWALYAERLADEMGVYDDDISRLGMLSNEAFRTARLVVDPGMHVMNWSREKAVSYMKEHTALEENIIEGEVDRYIMGAGQATSYLLGAREIMQLREAAKKKLGKSFDIKEFHSEVLKNGTVTLPMLRQQIEKWQKEVIASHLPEVVTKKE